jgi:hypothetical protein
MMKGSYSHADKLITLKLSRRNIKALLHMLDHRDKAIPALSSNDGEYEILVIAQEDDEHYAGRGHGAGRMSWEGRDE